MFVQGIERNKMATSYVSRISLSIAVISAVICSLQYFAYGEDGHIVQVVSLLPTANCTSIATGEGKKSLKVVHKGSACSQQTQGSTQINHTLILLQDQARVKSIQSTLFNGKTLDSLSDSEVNLTAKSIGTGNYIVTAGLGTPRNDLTFFFDTGSHLTWTQCQPCVGSCYRQVDPIFDPTQSSTYSNISCASPFCNITPGLCFGSTCGYDVTYGDGSYSIGYLATETLTLSPDDVFPDFIFGCGEDNNGTFVGASGLIGLSRHRVSLVYQTESSYGKYFSYCLPASSSKTGFLAFGKTSGPSNKLNFTNITAVRESSTFYGLELLGITVGGTQLSIPSTVFSAAGTIIDSGTVITRLPPTAYRQLNSTFQQMMSDYPRAPAFADFLDTCYDFSGFDTISVPKVIFSFGGDVNVDLHVTGILYAVDVSQVCLAFAANSLDTDLGIYGNVQQKTFEVAYDVAEGQIGFGPNAC